MKLLSRILVVVAILLFAVGLKACGGSSSSSAPTGSVSVSGASS